MKWIHIGDLHIGKQVHEFSMLNDQQYILNEIINIAKKEEVDGIIIAGDIYDRSIPSAEAVAVFDSFVTKLIEENIKVCMISGNHDSPERIGFAEKLLDKSGFYIANTAKNGIKKVSFEDEYGVVNVYLLPFARQAVMNHWAFQEEKKETTYSDCIKQLLENCNIKEKERNILVTHYFVIKSGEAPICSDSEQPIFVGGVEQVDGTLFDIFDYVALGHIHRPQKVGRETMRYCGSPLKYSFSEVNHEKSVSLIELKEKGTVCVKQILLKPLHDMRMIKGKLADLLSDEIVNLADKNDYIGAILTDEEALFEPMDKLRGVYPNMMQLIKEQKLHGEDVEETIAIEKRKTPLELYKEFYKKVTEKELDKKREHAFSDMINDIMNGEGEK